MKEKRNDRKKHKKSKKKRMQNESSNDSDSSDAKVEWVEASSIQSRKSKTKKKKHNRKSRSSSSSESESSMSNKCTVNESLPNTTTEERDSWMTEESFVPTISKSEMRTSSSRQRRADSMKEQREKEEKIQRERELNPHWKNDGTGVPEKETTVEDLNLPSTSVGDGGYSWLKKAYYRIQEQAQQEGRSMEDIAVERWGSLDKLVSLIEKAEERMKSHPDWKQSKNQFRERYHRDDKHRGAQFRTPNINYESEKYFDSPFQFSKPTDGCKNRKVLNQFKTSRKSYSEENSKYENSSSYASSNKQYLELEREDSKVQKRDSDHRIPAWKKVKSSSEKLDDAQIIPSKSWGIEHFKKHTVMQVPEQQIKEIDSMPLIYSEDDLNKLAAKQIKAELMGDTSLAQKLKEQLDEARNMVKEKGFAKQPSKKVEEVVLTKFDSQGQARPLPNTQMTVTDYKQKRKSNKYFDDGSSYSLKQMFEREKLTTSEDHLEMFVEASAQVISSNETDENGHISKKISKKLSSTHAEERDIGKAIQQHQKLSASLEKCQYCLDHIKKHLIIDIGDQIFLCLPNFQTITEGHCLIVPKNHVSSFLSLDENEWSEVDDFKQKLRKMFMSDKKSVIFIETSMNYKYFPHAVLECIPVPEEDGDMAPFYFKKAIQESETEWAHNKKLIDLRDRGLRRSVPKNLPYFHVEFDPKVHAGYAHVIEDEKYFPRNFGKEILGGMLDIDYNYLYKNKREDSLKKTKEVVDFQKRWNLCKSE